MAAGGAVQDTSRGTEFCRRRATVAEPGCLDKKAVPPEAVTPVPELWEICYEKMVRADIPAESCYRGDIEALIYRFIVGG